MRPGRAWEGTHVISSERQNMGTLDAMIRIALGSALVGAAAGRRLAGPLMWGLLAVGGWQIAQGVVRWDPIWEAAGID
ncbi:MAG TPA: DUF2892 domain-containing protein, partial [Limnochordia bacterium]|nr:DUF2892 domain-containing protein [Limnochordia bacterium]